MACVCFRRTGFSLLSQRRWPAFPSAIHEGYGLQLARVAESSNLQLKFYNTGQRIQKSSGRSWQYEMLPRTGDFRPLCQSHGYSNRAEESEDMAGDIQMDGKPSLLPTGLSFFLLAASALVLSQAALFLSVLRKRLQWGKMEMSGKHQKRDTTGQEADWEKGFTSMMLQQGGLGMALLSTSMIAKDRISPLLLTLRANPTFMSGLFAWAIAQVMKVFTTYFVERKWDLKMLLGSGGMPSSHSALCVGLTTSVAFCHGVSDSLFPVCLGFSLIVMYDAAGVRRHAGRQAQVLNMIVEDLFQGHPLSEKKLKELLGHTPLQVGVGALLGILVGYLCSYPSLMA